MDNSTIYSDNFKAWFGDWEKDPKNSSKVVDSEGRPLPVYHGTVRKTKDGLPFKVFKCESEMGEGAMFSDKYSVASFFSGGGEARFGNFADKFDRWEHKNTMNGLVDFLNTVLKNGKYNISYNEGDYNGKHYEFYRLNHEYPGGSTSSPLGDNKEKAYQKLLKEVEKEIYYLERNSKYSYNGGIYNVYLNIRNPYIFDAKGNNFFNLKTDFNQQNRINVFTLVSHVKKLGQYDGVIVKNVRETTSGNGILSTDYIVFKPNQIKHALDNNGNYDNNVDDMTENFVRECIREALVEMIDDEYKKKEKELNNKI